MKNHAATPAADKPDSASFVWVQDSDTCEDNDIGQELKVSTHDGGAGPFLVIETRRWSIDGDGIDAFADRLRWVLAQVKPD